MNVNVPWLTDRLGVMGFQPRAVQVVQLAIAAVLAVALCVGMKVYYDHQIISKHEAEVNVKVLQDTVKLNDIVADARASDAAKQIEQEKARADAIATATESVPSDPERRLGCERLRQSGYNTSRIPACN